jgi:uroporphyrinogen decarboxylase
MTFRERVQAAFAHREADRVPKGELWVDGGLANRLMGTGYPLDYLHFERDRAVHEFLRMDLVNVGDWPSERIGVDAAGIPKYRSVYGYEYIDNGISRHLTKPALEDMEDADAYPVPDIRRVSGALVERFAKETDFFVTAQIGGPVSMLDEMFPMEDFLVNAVLDTKHMRTVAEKVMAYEIQKALLFLDCGADAIVVADDIAFNSGVFLPPAVMEELVYPLYRQAVREIRKHRDVPILFHSDGDLNLAMDRIVESGFDGLQSLQPSAGMDIARIKREYGDVLCLMGNLDLDYLMTLGSPAEVEEAVKRLIDVAAPGGGFILSTCNTLIGAIPEANALAMCRTADTYGTYGR